MQQPSIDVRSYPLVSDQMDYDEISVIVRLLERALAKGIAGDVVELGCFTGTTALFIQRVLLQRRENRTFHVYDSFAGLPDKTNEDNSPAGEQFKGGELAASKQQLITHFRHARLPVPVIHKGWFADLTPADMPDRIAFAFLDGDFYGSIRDSFNAIQAQLSPGAIICVDDYQSEALPGARRATDAWAKARKLEVRSEKSLGIIIMPQ